MGEIGIESLRSCLVALLFFGHQFDAWASSTNVRWCMPSFLHVISAEHLEKAFYFGSLLRGICEWKCKVFDVQESSLNIYPKLYFHRHWRETLRLTPPIHKSKYRHLLAKKNPTLITFSLLRHTTGWIAPRHEHILRSCSDFLSQ